MRMCEAASLTLAASGKWNWPTCRLLLAASLPLPDPPKVSMVEVVAELEAVAEDAIHAGVAIEDQPQNVHRIDNRLNAVEQARDRGPYHRDGSKADQDEGQGFMVEQVVGGSTNTGVDQITEHADVRPNSQQHVDPPRDVIVG